MTREEIKILKMEEMSDYDKELIKAATSRVLRHYWIEPNEMLVNDLFEVYKEYAYIVVRDLIEVFKKK